MLMDYLPEPVSPMAQCLDSSSFWLYILGVLEFEVPVPRLHLMSFLTSLISIPRFSSILVRDTSGFKRWERVKVRLEDHIIEPTIGQDAMSKDSYAKCFSDYLSTIATEQLPHSKPLWEVHVINNSAAATTTLVFKVHHSIGDGYTLMGVLLSCLKRADDPSLPLTFPSLKSSKIPPSTQSSRLLRIPSLMPFIFTSVRDFGWSLLKSTLVEDDKTPIRSGNEGVEFQPTNIFSITFSMTRIKDIKSKLGVTVNDVITGIIFYGLRLYMQDVDYSSSIKNCTLLPMLNIRNVQGYQTDKDMRNSGGKGTWGNKFTYMHVSVPKFKDTHISDPLQFVWKVHHSMEKKRRSLLYSLICMLLQMKHQFQGPEVKYCAMHMLLAVGKHFHKTMRNSSLLISNMVGPLDQLALANYPIKSLYFTLSGAPQSLVITITSYMGMLRVTSRTEEGFIDEKKLESCVNEAFEIIHKAAQEMPGKT